MGKHRYLKNEEKDIIIKVYASTGNMSKSAQSVGTSLKHLKLEMERYAAFKEGMMEAMENYSDLLVEEAHNRAMNGKSKMSDALLMFLIKARKPEYREKHSTIDHNFNIKVISSIPRPDIKVLQEPKIEGVVVDELGQPDEGIVEDIM